MSSGLVKDDSTGKEKIRKERSIQKERWEDNIKEWTKMDFASTTKADEDD